MDKVTEYLTARPEGASAEEIAREALGLKGAVGPVASQVIRAAAETDPRITQAAGGLWTLREVSEEKCLRDGTYVTVVSRELPDGTLEITVTRVTFDGMALTESYLVPRGRSEAAGCELNRLEGQIQGAVPGGFRFATTRRRLNQVSRLQIGRDALPQGLCLSKLARRCFPDQTIRSCSDISNALGLAYVEPPDSEAMSKLQADLFLGLLERFEAREIYSLDAVREDLRPMVAAVDFEAFAFDEDYLDDLPACPGVYVMRDTDGKVIYVGKSVHLRDRVRTYFARRTEREEKTRKILDRIWTVEVQEVGSDLEAQILEARLIEATRPEFNTQVEVHERKDVSERAPFLIVLPSADHESVEVFCTRSDRGILPVRVRKDLTDWEEGWARLSAFLAEPASDLEPDEVAAHRILKGWVERNREKVNLIDVGDAGESAQLKRLVESHIREADDDDWEKVWRI